MRSLKTKSRKTKRLVETLVIIGIVFCCVFVVFSKKAFALDLPESPIGGTIGSLILMFAHFLVYLSTVAARILDVMFGSQYGSLGFIFSSTAESGGYFKDLAPVLNQVWNIVRNLANMLFILGILVIAFGTVFRIQSYHIKALLPSVIIGLLLVNFSFLISRAVVEFGEVSSRTVGGLIGEDQNKVGGAMLDAFFGLKLPKYKTLNDPTYKKRLDEIENFEQFSWTNLTGKAADPIIDTILFTFYCLCVLLAMGSLAVFMLIRLCAIFVLVGVSPLAFLFLVLPPTRGLTGSWFRSLFKYALYAPIALFFVAIGLNIMTVTNASKTLMDAFGKTEGFVNLAIAQPTALMGLFLGMIMVAMGIIMSRFLGLAGANAVIGTAGRYLRGGGRIAGGAAILGGAGYLAGGGWAGAGAQAGVLGGRYAYQRRAAPFKYAEKQTKRAAGWGARRAGEGLAMVPGIKGGVDFAREAGRRWRAKVAASQAAPSTGKQLAAVLSQPRAAGPDLSLAKQNAQRNLVMEGMGDLKKMGYDKMTGSQLRHQVNIWVKGDPLRAQQGTMMGAGKAGFFDYDKNPNDFGDLMARLRVNRNPLLMGEYARESALTNPMLIADENDRRNFIDKNWKNSNDIMNLDNLVQSNPKAMINTPPPLVDKITPGKQRERIIKNLNKAVETAREREMDSEEIEHLQTIGARGGKKPSKVFGADKEGQAAMTKYIQAQTVPQLVERVHRNDWAEPRTAAALRPEQVPELIDKGPGVTASNLRAAVSQANAPQYNAIKNNLLAIQRQLNNLGLGGGSRRSAGFR